MSFQVSFQSNLDAVSVMHGDQRANSRANILNLFRPSFKHYME